MQTGLPITIQFADGGPGNRPNLLQIDFFSEKNMKD